jgi:hypothetical protein
MQNAAQAPLARDGLSLMALTYCTIPLSVIQS